MSKIVAVTACPTGIAHTIMAAEALQQAADRTGHSMQVETQGSAGTRNTLTEADIAAADAVIIAADTHVNTDRFAGKNLLEVGTEPAIRDAEAVIRQALGQADPARAALLPLLRQRGTRPCRKLSPSPPARPASPTPSWPPKAWRRAPRPAGYTIKVETQGSVGAQNTLTAAEIAGAEIVLIAADT